jgi:hypothetical protein
MKKNKIIRDRASGQPTRYFLGARNKAIINVGSFPSQVHRMWDAGKEIQQTYELAAITADFVYYNNEEESDETACIVMLTRNFNLVSDNFFASNDLAHLVERNEGLLWISNPIKYWQIEQFIQPEKITTEIKNMLQRVNEDKLTKEEKVLYFAYRHNGPVKYSKAQSLMAVIATLDQGAHSDQLVAITQILDQKKKN